LKIIGSTTWDYINVFFFWTWGNFTPSILGHLSILKGTLWSTMGFWNTLFQEKPTCD
jgi:hypothetical protein